LSTTTVGAHSYDKPSIDSTDDASSLA
jgi:hypothetical protein